MSGRLSQLAQGLVGSEILKIAAEVRDLIAQGRPICNLTVGDFSPSEFRVPERLARGVADYVAKGQTNYPPSNGVLELRKAVSAFYKRGLGLDYPVESIVITSGGRPVIYGAFQTLVNAGERVVYPVPSWNNNHYASIVGAKPVEITCGADTNFLPTAALLKGAVRGATLLSLNSPSNPTGTMFTAEQLADICDLVLDENARRGPDDRPLYVMYDQIYWMLTFGGGRHVNPVSLRPEMAKYTIFVDGISKAFAATGLRVGWGVGPADVIKSMADLLTHIGAWAPRPEQMATGELLCAVDDIRTYHAGMLRDVQERLTLLAEGIDQLRGDGFPVESTAPQGAIYLSARFALHGKRTPDGEVLQTNEAIRRYLLHSAGLAAVQFQAFGQREETGWFRLSAGAVSPQDVRELIPRLRQSLQALS
ncbi:MAG TPA: aminotransferase class I/II-fold pyridoxal phosphate-dependent enzyme [Gemmatimonadaceae bacterium]|nr:aminotransferase class I/II-fold pyridoxal phosphate-dependent enzyme [Gemmatimonadaceae bacterium]